MSDLQNDLRNYVESSADPVTAEEVMGAGLATRRPDQSARRGLVVALAAAAAVFATVVSASFFINQAPDQVAPIGTTATSISSEPSVTSSTLPTTTTADPSSTTIPDATAVPVSALFDGEGPRDAVVAGFVIWDANSARLCESLLKSLPPQCGGMSLVIADPQNLTASSGDSLAFEESQGVRWTASVVEVEVYFDGDRLIAGGPEAASPTAEDQALIDAFVAFAASPDQALADAVPFASDVALGLGPDIVKTAPADTLGDPSVWILDAEIFRAYTGPFSALDLVEEPLVVTVGAHPHCASAPMPSPEGFESYRRISIQPESADSCLRWWTVDFFLNANGEIAALTMDVYEP